MAQSIEMMGKTVEEARQAAIQELGVPESRTSFEVIEEPKKGFFGFGGRDAKVRVTVLEPKPLEKAEEFLQNIFASMKLDVQLQYKETENGHVYSLQGEKLGILIGKHGQTLDALQYLANLAANNGLTENKVRVILDVENYRERREETLRNLARRIGDKVRRTGERIMLEPMNRHERKIVHLALQDNTAVKTFSSGEEPFRKVVVECVERPRRGGYRRGRYDRGGYDRGGYDRGDRYSRYPRQEYNAPDESASVDTAAIPQEQTTEN